MWRRIAVGLLLGLAPLAGAGAQQRVVTGLVVDESSGAPLNGVNVQILGTRQGTFGRPDGTFAVAVPPGPVKLRISRIGYRSADVPVENATGRLRIALAIDVLNLEELVVTGQATSVSKKNLANAVAKVNSDQLAIAPAASLEQVLAGKIAGADVQSNSGAPGGGLQVRLRGVSTILGSSNPLYVVDGVIVSDAQIGSGAYLITKSSTNPAVGTTEDNSMNRIADLNLNDVESIEVLKGASAAAIYGAKANNGVVVITTKRGNAGTPRFTLSQRFGTSMVSKTPGLRRFNSLADAVAAFGPKAADYWKSGAYFDHDEELAGTKPLSYQTAFSVSGGSEATRYYASGLVEHDGGIIASTYYDKQALKLNIDQTIGGRITLNVSSSATHTKDDRGLTQNDNDGTSYYMIMPSTPSFFDARQRADGSWPVNPFGNSNPLQTAALLKNQENVYRFIGSSRLSVQAVSSKEHTLTFNVTGGADYFNQKNTLFSPPALQFEPLTGLPGTAILGNAGSTFLNLNANVVHVFSPNASVTATTSLGSQSEYRDLDNGQILQKNLIAGMDNIQLGTAPQVREGRQTTKDFGIFAQEEVLVKEKLLLTAGVRGDKSSNNSDVNQYYYYPKAAASYRLTSFLPPGMSELKVRAAWGESGNEPLYGQKFTEYNGANIEGLPTVEVQGQTAATNIRPERQKEVEAGLDATLFGGHAQLGLTLYQKNVSDLLLQRQLASSQGFTIAIFNGGELRTRGVEAELNAVPLKLGRFSWTTQESFALNRSIVLSLPVPSFQTGGFGYAFGTYLAQQGQPLTQLWGNATVNGQRVLAKVGDANPTFIMGFINDLKYGAATLTSVWSWQKGGAIVNLTHYLYDLRQAGPDCNDMVNGVSVCTKRFTDFPGNTRVYLEDGTYAKLRELTLKVAVPQRYATWLVGTAHDLELALSGRNLLTITKYSGMDPEVSNFGNQAIARNIDVAPYPPSRTFWFSLNVGF